MQSSYPKWTFLKQNDVTFASQFPEWCSSHQLSPEIDLLFIDTSHLYQHTLEELRLWMPYLAAKSKMILHDTNMRKIIGGQIEACTWAGTMTEVLFGPWKKR